MFRPNYGRYDIARFLASVPMECVLWSEYTLG